jgi:hypothetical protein
MNGIGSGGARLHLRKSDRRLGALFRAAPRRLDPSRCGHSAKRALNGPNENGLIKRLLDRHYAWLKRPDCRNLTADENVRNEASAKYLLDGSYAASNAQSRIDNHQVWLASNSGGYRTSLGCLDCANVMAHPCKDVGQ